MESEKTFSHHHQQHIAMINERKWNCTFYGIVCSYMSSGFTMIDIFSHLNSNFPSHNKICFRVL